MYIKIYYFRKRRAAEAPVGFKQKSPSVLYAQTEIHPFYSVF